MNKTAVVNQTTRVSLLAILLLSFGGQCASARTETSVSPGAYVCTVGARVNIPAGLFINEGHFTDTTSPGILAANGGVVFSGSGTTSLYNLEFINGGSSVLNSLVSVFDTVTVSAGTTVDANNNIYLRTDLKAGANIVVEGVLKGNVQGIAASASATSGTGSSYSSVLSINISGTVVNYQWESSTDAIAWSAVTGATSATYNALVSATVYYRCITTTSNSSFVNVSTPVKLNMPLMPTHTAIVADELISICPNPTTGNIMIISKNVLNITVLDMTGRILKNASKAKSISIAEFCAGTYFIKLFDDGNEMVYTSKVIKE